jgi:hypothetical protein
MASRERMTEALIEKSAARQTSIDLVAAFLSNGGKVKPLPCQGISPRDGGKHYCDPRDRSMLNRAMLYRAPRIARCNHTIGESRLLQG